MVMVEPRWLRLSICTLFLCNFLTWEEQTGLPFDKMAHCMFSVAEILWHRAADSHFPNTPHGEVGKLLPSVAYSPLQCFLLVVPLLPQSISVLAPFWAPHFKVCCCTGTCSMGHNPGVQPGTVVGTSSPSHSGGQCEQHAWVTQGNSVSETETIPPPPGFLLLFETLHQ